MFFFWISQQSAPVSLAIYACWYLWTERNFSIFEERPPSVRRVFHRILAAFSWQPTSIKTFPSSACNLDLTAGHTLVCFDGASQMDGSVCGAGGTFKHHQARVTKWFLNCGGGTNTKAELLGLWVSLTLAARWSINHLLVLGDSRVIIDWITQKCNLHSIHIEGWLHLTRNLSEKFSSSITNTFLELSMGRRMPSRREH
jgi:ribonuclease HI